MTDIYFEDYVLDATRETLGRTITEADIVLHAGQTGDFFPHHMDAEWCKTQDFKQKTAYEIASGDWSSDVCSSDLHAALRRCASQINRNLGIAT